MKYNKKWNIFWVIIFASCTVTVPIELFNVFIKGENIPRYEFAIYGITFFFSAIGLLFGELEKYYHNKTIRLQKEIETLDDKE
ncbi:hypothetical protein FJQ98_15860 [Lysinibacillus agricola]|uniref:Uncharacterized protein n=1 Tax=Lysinibacillus agricola TaxID=2590012 RepID=A0ABX7ALF5_9BACI|nr:MULTISPECIES: hypothetical protein [Lysinibacillus]KOS60385.1 hypothetical protein AN161_23695 [Lysinibacillus sp. FJAT-14222]QQP10722.1 hypothetical protein FJQ98_15860 [Lysinibacillus agricola]